MKKLNLIVVVALLCCNFFVLDNPQPVKAQDTITVNFDDPLPSGVDLRSGEIAAQGIAGSDGAVPSYAYGWPVLTTSETHDWWSGTFGIEYDTVNQCWWMNDLIRMYELPASYGTEPDNYDDDSWLAWSNGLYHEGVSAGLTSTWFVSDMLKVDGLNLGDYDGYRFGCAYSADGVSWTGTTTCSFDVGEPYPYDRSYFRIVWRGDSNFGHRESQQASWNRANWVLGDSWRACVQGYPNWVGNEVRLSIEIPASSNGESAIEWNAYADGETVNAEIVSYTATSSSSQYIERVYSAGGEWLAGNATIADDTVRVELVLPSDTILDNVTLTFVPPDHTGGTADYILPLTADSEDDHYDIFSANVGLADRESIFAMGFIEAWNSEAVSSPSSPPINNNGNEYTLLYYSQHAGDLVHSPTQGIVTAITAIDSTNCSSTTTGDLASVLVRFVTQGYPLAQAVASFIALGTTTICEIDGGPVVVDSMQDTTIGILPAGDVVTIDDYGHNKTFYYFVADASEYLTVGQTIGAGCVLGETVPVIRWSDTLQIDETGAGLGLIWVEDDSYNAIDVQQNLMIYPDSDEPCSTPTYQTGACINGNADFIATEPFYWDVGQSALYPYPPAFDGEDLALSLTGDGANDTGQLLTLDQGTQLAVRISGYVLEPNSGGTPSLVNVDLGDTTIQFEFDESGAWKLFDEALAAYTDSDYGDQPLVDLDVSAGPTQDGTVIIDQLCVMLTEPPAAPVRTCVFDDYGLADPGSWTTTGGASFGNGLLLLPTSATISQDLAGLPAEDYTLEVRYRPERTTTPTPPFAIDNTATLSDSTPATVDSDSFTDSLTDDNAWITETLELNNPSEQDITFTYTNNATGGNIEIDELCLVPENLPTVGSEYCGECAASYLGDVNYDLPEAVSWLDCRTRQLYYCDYRDLVVSIDDNTAQTVRGIGMLGRWMSATTTKQNIWLRGAFWYIGGHFDNLITALVNALGWQTGSGIVVVSDSPAGFWDVMDSLINGLRDVLVTLLDDLLGAIQLLIPLAGLLLDAALAIVGLMETIILAVIAQIQSLVYFVNAIMQATNQSSSELPGGPNCTASLASGDADFYCWGFYILDNTIFAGPAGLFLPLVMSAAAINALLWGFNEVKEAVANAG